MFKSLDFPLPAFFSKAESSEEAPSAEDSDVVRVAYTTNPATNVDEGKPIEMVFNWVADSEGQVQDFIDNAVLELEVNGAPLAARITYGKILPDESTGGFSTQVIAEIGKLPPGTNTVVLTISWKQKITNGKDSFGPGTGNEQVQEEARIIVNPPPGAQPVVEEPDFSNCPPDEDMFAAEAVWDESTGEVYL